MAKRKTNWTEQKILAYIKEGRGQGHGFDYKPWLTNQDFSSIGRTHRPVGWTTGRKYFCASDIEYYYFLYLDWLDYVVDIREQFPLLPLETTQAIAAEAQIPHSRDPKSKVDVVLTTDFVADVREHGKTRLVARTVKKASDLSSRRKLEKLEIERRYWYTRNIDWGIVTERDIPKILVSNLAWFHADFFQENVEVPYSGYHQEVIHNITPFISNHSELLLADACVNSDRRFQLKPGESLKLMKYMMARKLVVFDVDNLFGPDIYVGQITFPDNLELERLA